MTIQPLVLTWLNASLPLGSHRFLYCVIISILKKHLLLSYCQFNCVPPWGISRKEIEFLNSHLLYLPFQRKGVIPERDVGRDKPSALHRNWAPSLQTQHTSVQGCQPHRLTTFLQISPLEGTSWTKESSCYLKGISTSQLSQEKRRI